jgi:Lipocalin-like domain
MGTDALGYLLYTAEHRFAVMISRTGRARFAASDLLSGTTAEKARAGEGFVAYAGRYSFYGDQVVHHVELSLFPNWVGTDQQRTVDLAGDRLTLSASPCRWRASSRCPAWSGNGSTPPRAATDRCVDAAAGRQRKRRQVGHRQAGCGQRQLRFLGQRRSPAGPIPRPPQRPLGTTALTRGDRPAVPQEREGQLVGAADPLAATLGRHNDLLEALAGQVGQLHPP